MLEKTIKTQIIHKHDIAERWEQDTRIPKKGELIVYDDRYTEEDGNEIIVDNFIKYKIGNGVDTVADLPFASNVFQGYTEASTVSGTNTIAGCRGFNILAIDPVGYDSTETAPTEMHLTLDSVEGLAVDDSCSVAINKNYMEMGKITNISENTITINAYPDDLTAAIISTTVVGGGEKLAYVFVSTKQTIGTTIFGSAQHAEGYETAALMIASHAEGAATIASGKYSHAEGDSTFAGYAAHAEGQRTKALGGVSHAEGSDTTASGVSSHAEGQLSTASGRHSHAEGYQTTAEGKRAHSEGYKTSATGTDSHSEGSSTTASGEQSHAEGAGTTASGNGAHAEGRYSTASGQAAHAEGNSTLAKGYHSHAEGMGSKAYGHRSHAEGNGTTAGIDGQANATDGAHAEGVSTTASGKAAHAEGSGSIASGESSHAEGNGTAKGHASHAEGNATASNSFAHAEGDDTVASGYAAHAEGVATKASSFGAHAEGAYTTASGFITHAEGNNTTASGGYSHAEGVDTVASGYGAHAEGTGSVASGEMSHAEGNTAKAYAKNSHAEGLSTTTGSSTDADSAGDGAHAEGRYTKAIGQAAHAEGNSTEASGAHSHAEGTNSKATASRSHAEGFATIASIDSQHVQGKYNVEDSSAAHIVGWGTSDSSRKNIHTISTTGNAWFAGNVSVGSDKQRLVKLTELEAANEQINELKNNLSESQKEIEELRLVVNEGASYQFETDDTIAYAKSIPSKAMPCATIDRLGGRTSSYADGSVTPRILKLKEESRIQGNSGTIYVDTQYSLTDTNIVTINSSYVWRQKDAITSYQLRIDGFPAMVVYGTYDQYVNDNRETVYSPALGGSYIFDELHGEYYEASIQKYIVVDGEFIPAIYGNFIREYAEGSGEGDFYYREVKFKRDIIFSGHPDFELSYPNSFDGYLYPNRSYNERFSLSFVGETASKFTYVGDFKQCTKPLYVNINGSYYRVELIDFYDDQSGEVEIEHSSVELYTYDAASGYTKNENGSYFKSFTGGLERVDTTTVYDGFGSHIHLMFDGGFCPNNKYSSIKDGSMSIKLVDYTGPERFHVKIRTSTGQYILSDYDLSETATVSVPLYHNLFQEDESITDIFLAAAGDGYATFNNVKLEIYAEYEDLNFTYPPLPVTAIKIGNMVSYIDNMLIPETSFTTTINSYSGLTISYDSSTGIYTLNGTVSGYDYFEIRDPYTSVTLDDGSEVVNFNLTHIGGSISTSGDGRPDDVSWEIAVSDDFSAGWAWRHSLNSDSTVGKIYSMTSCVGDFGLTGTTINGFVLRSNSGEYSFNNFQFKLEFGPSANTFDESTCQVIEIPNEVQSIEGYGVGNHYIYNYINFESLTFVRRCKLETNGNVTPLSVPEYVDVSAYFDNGNINVKNRDVIVFENETKEPVASSISYQVKI